MGVKGLSTYLTDFRTDLSVVHRFEGRRRPVPAIADGLGILFNLYYAYCRWEDGGEYFAFYTLVRRLVKAWRAVGIELVFVFDGSKPLAKHATIIRRHEESIRNAAKLHVALESEGSVLSFRGKRIMPMFCFDAMVAALHSLKVSMEFVPQGEADAAVVAVAQRRGAYVLGNDSDFMVLMAGATNVRGYIPTEGIQWVSDRKRKCAIMPPRSMSNPALHVLVYSNVAFCKHLNVPSHTLALISSLVGNDYLEFELFWDRVRETVDPEKLAKPYWRIQHVAKVVREIPTPEMRTEADAIAYVRTVVSATRKHRKIHDEIVGKVVAAMLQYSLPTDRRCCGAYPFCVSEDCSGGEPLPALKTYVNAQRAGRLKLLTNAFMAPDRLYPWGLPEDPRFPSARSSAPSQKVRAHAYGIFFAAVAPQSEVTEYDRTPELHLEANILPISLSSSAAACLLPLHERIAMYLASFGDVAAHSIRKLPPHLHPLAAAIRLCVLLPPAHGRWTYAEVVAVTTAAIGSLQAFNLHELDGSDSILPRTTTHVPLTNRCVQRVAQFVTSLHDLHHVAQALVLSTPGNIKTHLSGWKFVDGPAIHSLLNGQEPKGDAWIAPSGVDVQRVVAAVLTGLQVDGYPAPNATQPARAQALPRPARASKPNPRAEPPVNVPAQIQSPPAAQPKQAQAAPAAPAPSEDKKKRRPRSRKPKAAPDAPPATAPSAPAAKPPPVLAPAHLVPSQIGTKAPNPVPSAAA